MAVRNQFALNRAGAALAALALLFAGHVATAAEPSARLRLLPIPPEPPALVAREAAAEIPRRLDLTLSPSNDATVDLVRSSPSEESGRPAAARKPSVLLDVGTGQPLSLRPTMRFDGGAVASRYDPRVAPAHAVPANPTPGLAGAIELKPGVTLNTQLNAPFRRTDLVTADGRPASQMPNLGVDLKLKF